MYLSVTGRNYTVVVVVTILITTGIVDFFVSILMLAQRGIGVAMCVFQFS